MKRFNQISSRNRLLQTSVTLLVLGVLIPWAAATENSGNVDRYATKKPTPNPSISSATASSSSSSESIDGITRSHSMATGAATGNASGAADANGAANSSRMQKGQLQSRQADSAARIRVRGQNEPTARYPSMGKQTASERQSSAMSTVQADGLSISRSVQDEDGVKITKLDVSDKTHEISLRHSSDDGIEVRVRDRKKNADGSVNEKVYTAATREELQQQAPGLMRKLMRYEKLAGTTAASTGRGDAPQQGIDPARSLRMQAPLAMPPATHDSKEVMQDQLRHMLQQHAGNPSMQNMIRQMIESLEQN